MSSPEAIAELLDRLDAPEVFGAVLDTGHLVDAGLDPARVLEAFPGHVDEVQLKGAASSVPRLGPELDAWIAAAPRSAALVVEHRARCTVDEVRALAKGIAEAWRRSRR